MDLLDAKWTWSLGIVVWCVLWSSLGFADLGKWEVKRRDRLQRIRAHRLQLLASHPTSYRHLWRVWTLYTTRASRRALLRYAKRKKASPRHARSWGIIWARLLILSGARKRGCKELYRINRTPPSGWSTQYLEWRCRLRLRGDKRVLVLFRTLWSGTRHARTKSGLLLRMADYHLRLSRQAGFHQELFRLAARHQWQLRERLRWTALLLRTGLVQRGLLSLSAAHGQAKGNQRFRIGLRLVRLCLKHKAFAIGVEALRVARRGPGLPLWLQKQHLASEVKLYRQAGQLVGLYHLLVHRWSGSLTYARVVLLGQLAEECKLSHAWKWYHRALSFRPRAALPRRKLIRHFFKHEQSQLAFRHMMKLVTFGTATGKEHLRLVHHFLHVLAEHPRLARWEPSWEQRVRVCRPTWKPKTDHAICLLRPLCRKQVQCASARWKSFRETMWKEWVLRSSAQEKRAYTRALEITKKALVRFPRDWSLLLQLENLMAAHGEKALREKVLSTLLRATAPKVIQVRPVIRLLLLERLDPRLVPWLQNKLRRSAFHPVHAVQMARLSLGLSQFVAPWKGRRALPVGWRKGVCGVIKGQLASLVRKPSIGSALRLSLAEQLFVCGYPMKRFGGWLRRLERRALQRPVLRVAVLKTYMRSKAKTSLLRFFYLHRTKREKEALGQSFRAFIKGPSGLSVDRSMMRQVLQKSLVAFPDVAVSWLRVICRIKVSCEGWKKLLSRVSVHPRLAVGRLVDVLEKPSEHKLFLALRLRVLRIWLARRLRRRQQDRLTLLLRPVLFRDDRQLRRLQLTELSSVLSVRKKRLPAPLIEKTAMMLRQYQTETEPQQPTKQAHRRLCRLVSVLAQSALPHLSVPWKGVDKRAAESIGRGLHLCEEKGLVSAGLHRSLLLSFSKGANASRRRLALFRFVLFHQLAGGLRVLLRDDTREKKRTAFRRIRDMASALTAEEKQTFVGEFQFQCFQKVGYVSPFVSRVMKQLCVAGSGLCVGLFRCMIPMMHSRNANPAMLLQLLRQARKSRVHEKIAYSVFLKRLVKYWKAMFVSDVGMLERDFGGLVMLARDKRLFVSGQPVVQRELLKIHVALLGYVLGRLPSPPVGLDDWVRWLRGYRARMKSVPFVSLYRMAPSLATPGRVVRWERFVLSWLGKERDVMARTWKLLKQKPQRWVSHVKGLPDSEKAKWLLLADTQRLGASLRGKLRGMWENWFTAHQNIWTLLRIRRWFKRCCVDRASARMVYRLLVWHGRRKGLAGLSQEANRVLRWLSPPERRVVEGLLRSASARKKRKR